MTLPLLVLALAPACKPTTRAQPGYAVRVAVSGLGGGRLVLRNGGGDDLVVAADGVHVFAVRLAQGARYAVTVAAQPESPSQTCTVSQGRGTVISSDVTSVSVRCTRARLYFAADDGTGRSHLWRSDGTAAGTAPVLLGFAGSLPRGFTVHEGLLFYAAQGTTTTAALWRSDGTAVGTTLVADVVIAISPFGVEARRGATTGWFTPFEGALYFPGRVDASGTELWRTDGTPAGTAPVADLAPGPQHALPWGLTALPGGLFFCATDGAHGVEPWITDGTAAGTRMLRDVNPGPADGCDPSRQPTAFRGAILFQADDGVHGSEPWRTDGTAAGTRMLKDVNPGAAGSHSGFTGFDFVPLGDVLIFQAEDAAHGVELWRTDGTEAGTVLVRDIADGPAGSVPQEMLVVGAIAYLQASDAAHGAELWRTDGTAEGTSLVANLCSGPCPSSPRWLRSLEGGLVFLARDLDHGDELWRSDLTEAGTGLIGESAPGPAGLLAWGFTRFDGALYFGGVRPGPVLSLWRTDGTAPGTTELGLGVTSGFDPLIVF